MQLKKVKKICKGMLTVFCILCPAAVVALGAFAILEIKEIPRYVTTLLILAPVIWMALTWAFCLVYWRCPVCGRFLGGLCDGSICRHCDHAIDLEAWSGGRSAGEKEFQGANRRRGRKKDADRDPWDIS